MTLTCAGPNCRMERPAIDMARVWVKDGWFPLCHPADAEKGTTCFDKYQHGHAFYGEPVTVLVDRKGPRAGMNGGQPAPGLWNRE